MGNIMTINKILKDLFTRRRAHIIDESALLARHCAPGLVEKYKRQAMQEVDWQEKSFDLDKQSHS